MARPWNGHMTRDSLRATLDNLQVDPESAQDRPYLEAMLRRLGYTEKEIREELGPVPTQAAADAPAPVTREYRLVVPARESAFQLDNTAHNDSPLESDLDFQEVDELQFEEVDEADEADANLDEVPLDTFGDKDVAPSSRTRVRVKRVRAKSRAEAESKVATKDRHVIKAVPVDIVERWGDGKTGGR